MSRLDDIVMRLLFYQVSVTALLLLCGVMDWWCSG